MYLFGWLGYFLAYFTINWRNSVVLALSLCTTERCRGTGHKACLYTPLRCLSWQMSKEVCSWYDELQVIYNMQWANCSCDDEMEQRWQKELRLQIASELHLAELTVQLTNWTDPTRQWTSGSWADRLHRSWHLKANLTHCNRNNKSLSNCKNTVELTECSRADTLQIRRADISSNMLSWYDKLIWTDRVQLSWQFAAEQTKCELTYGSWGQLIHVAWPDLCTTEACDL